MRRTGLIKLMVSAAVFAVAAACSTTRLIPDGQYRLVKNEIIVEGDTDFETSKISPYIKQKPFWSPMLYVYNWAGRDSSFMTGLLKSLGSAPVIYNAGLTQTSAENMERQMEYLGYYNSSIKANVKTEDKSATVQYLVRPGNRYIIRNFGYELPDNEEFKSVFYADTANVSIHNGEYLSLAALEAESIRAAAYLREKGYYDIDKTAFSFIADTLKRDGYADLTMTVVQKPEGEGRSLIRYKFGNVSISYPKSIKFREKVLKDLNTIKPGRPYSESAINTSYSRFSALSALSGVRITLDRSTFDDGIVDCEIALTPAKQRGVKLNIEGSSNSNGLIGISPEITYYSRNIFKGSETLNLTFLGDWQFKPGTDIKSTEFGVSGGITFPRFLLLPSSFFRDRVPTTQIKASMNAQDRPEYKRDIFSTSYTYLWSKGRLYYQLTPLGISLVKLHHIDDSFLESLSGNPFLKNAYQSHLDIGSSFTVYYTTDASVVPQGAYSYVRLKVDMSGNILSLIDGSFSKNEDGSALIWKTPYSQYVRGELTLGRTWSLGGNFTLATRLLAGVGYAYGNSSAMPFEKHFYSGGANSLRGWQARAVGPGYAKKNDSFVIPSQTGDLKLEANAELRFGIYSILSGAVFTDVGNIWTINSESSEQAEGRFNLDNLPGSLAADWGFGLRFNFSVLLLRLDMGLKLRDPSLDGSKWVGPGKWFRSGGNAIHLGVGYPF